MHFQGFVAANAHRIVGAHGHFGDFGLKASRRQSFLHRFKISRCSDDFNATLGIAQHILRTRFERDFDDLLFVRAGRKQELAAVFELVGDRALGAQIAAVFAKGVAHFSDRAHFIVRHGIDHDGRASVAIAFVTNFFVVHAFEVAGGFVHIALDVLSRHIHSLGLVDCQTQARVHIDVAAARACRDDDLARDTRPDLTPLFILATLAVLNIRPFAMTCHTLALNAL